MLPPVLIQGDRFNIRKKKIVGWIKGPIDVISGTIAPKKPLKDTKTQSFFRACQGYARLTKKASLASLWFNAVLLFATASTYGQVNGDNTTHCQ